MLSVGAKLAAAKNNLTRCSARRLCGGSLLALVPCWSGGGTATLRVATRVMDFHKHSL